MGVQEKKRTSGQGECINAHRHRGPARVGTSKQLRGSQRSRSPSQSTDWIGDNHWDTQSKSLEEAGGGGSDQTLSLSLSVLPQHVYWELCQVLGGQPHSPGSVWLSG
ncbi:Hypothetical predicted protein [Marmota monax]|uniref:Uncharacterized protein n=1 Tax=Marmota monax TaxID=9995 RepID=A0A5E4BA62_MARMO|nr:hypothetical protein GHT09_009223 [Marmota monax]VTJ65749.1 Hypothetical predicted protein [Marmota monax]